MSSSLKVLHISKFCVWIACFHFRQSDNFSKLKAINWKRSMNFKLPIEKVMNFSPELGIASIFLLPSTTSKAFLIIKWLSYPRRIWKTIDRYHLEIVDITSVVCCTSIVARSVAVVSDFFVWFCESSFANIACLRSEMIFGIFGC